MGFYSGERWAINPPAIDADKASAVVALATDLHNRGVVTYVMGGRNNYAEPYELDCAGFVNTVFEQAAGKTLGWSVDYIIQSSNCVMISRDNMQAGDTIIFQNTYCAGPSHVGICIGGDQFVHNANSTDNTKISSLSESYWSEHFYGVGRVVWIEGSNTGVPSKDINNYTLGESFTATATAYGSSVQNSMGGDGQGITASGAPVLEGTTIAVDPSVIPLGTMVKIDSTFPGISGIYQAQDTGGAIVGNVIDIYMDDSIDPEGARNRMLSFGKQTVQVTILNPKS
jgi:3D (Asp-Asp-Asp) domain-containing protein